MGVKIILLFKEVVRFFEVFNSLICILFIYMCISDDWWLGINMSLLGLILI